MLPAVLLYPLPGALLGLVMLVVVVLELLLLLVDDPVPPSAISSINLGGTIIVL